MSISLARLPSTSPQRYLRAKPLELDSDARRAALVCHYAYLNPSERPLSIDEFGHIVGMSDFGLVAMHKQGGRGQKAAFSKTGSRHSVVDVRQAGCLCERRPRGHRYSWQCIT